MTHHAKQLTQQQFGTHAQGYVNSPTHASGSNLDRLVEAVAPRPGMRALDIATGGGHTARRLWQAGAWTVAGDLTLPMLRAARASLCAQGCDGVTFVQLDAEDLPFATGAFDAVTCRIAPHHFPDVARFVREMARVVRPGGVVGVVDQLAPSDPKAARYINAFERLRDPSHLWAYNQAEWEGFFTGAGLAVETVETFAVDHTLGEWTERMGCDAATTLRLRAMMVHAPEPVVEWMRPHVTPVGDPTFVIRQILIVGRKG